jgi:hypothetical protein
MNNSATATAPELHLKPADDGPTLESVIAANTVTVRLAPGTGYVVDNSRWLHGRGAHVGRRVLLRILGDLRPEVDLPAGFDVP